MEGRDQKRSPSNVVDGLMKLQRGDVVRLAASVTLAEFGLALCDDDGVGLEIDGVVWDVKPHMVNVMIRRMHSRPAPFAWQESSVARWVKPDEVLEVIEGEARLWPTAAALKSVSDARDGKSKKTEAPIMWTVGVDEIPEVDN